MRGAVVDSPPGRGRGARVLIASRPEGAAAAVARWRAAGWEAMARLDSAAPSGPARVGWAHATLSAVELTHHWLFARAVLPADDVLVLVDMGDRDAAGSLAELLRNPRVSALPDGPVARAETPPVDVALPERERAVLDQLHDPVALARAAEQSGDQGWVLRPSTLLELRERLLHEAGVPPEDPRWGEGGWAWWRHSDAARAATMLEDLIARAEAGRWPWGPKLRLSLGVCRLLYADPALSLGLLERALVEVQTEPANDDEILARLGLIIARDRAGQDSRPLMEETLRRAGPQVSARQRAQVQDALGAAHHRAGAIDEALAAFRRAEALAREGGIRRFEVLARSRILDVAITTARIEPDLAEIRALRAEVASAGGVRSAMTVVQLQGDVARRLGRLDEAEEAYRTLRGLHPAGPARIGFALLALEREDFDAAAPLLRDALDTRELTGRRPTHLIEALSLPLAEHRGDLARWEAALDAWPLAVRGGQIDAARAAEAAAKLAWRRGEVEAGVRGARATRLAMAHWRALDRPDLARAARDRAVEAHQAGWPVPLGPLDLLQPVARGGTSVVWRARHRELDLEVAVKVLTGDQARDPAAVAALDAEVKATARLRHPHIVAVRDLGRVDDLASALGGEHLPVGSPYVALEWVPGGTLARRTEALPWEALRAVLDQLLDALGHAHGHGLLHRDVKPENVMWAGEERGLPVVKLVDFGLTGVGGDLVSGTPSYMAPEQFRGEGVGPWSDLYAVGCLTVTLVQGRPPFSGRSLRDLQEAHCRAPVPPLEPRTPVPADLGDWLEGMLAKDPSGRFPTAGAARHALAALGPASSRVVQPRVEIAAADNRTIVLSELDDLAPAAVLASPPVERPLAPVPPRRRRIAPPFPRPLGRALAGMGTPPLVGRSEAQEALWAALEASATGARAAVVVHGPPGVGVSHLLAWFGREVRAAGCAVVLEGLAALPHLYSTLRRGALTVVIADRPTEADEAALWDALAGPTPLTVVVGSREPAQAGRWAARGARSVALDRLGLEQLVVLARDLAPLSGEVALALARAADGSPGALNETLLEGLRADAFLPTRAGLVIRPGANPTRRALPQIAEIVLAGRDRAQRRALTVVALLGAHPEAARAVWRGLGLEDAAAGVADLIEEVGGALRLRQPGGALALLQAGPDPDLLVACAEALARLPGPEALALRVSLLVRTGRVGEGVDLLAELAWSWPGDPGELRLLELVREATDALAATGAGSRDARWGRLALAEARAALLGVNRDRVAEALGRAEATDLPEAATRVPYLRAVLLAQVEGWPAAVALLDAAMATEAVAQDPACRVRYAILRALYAGDLDGLAHAGEEAESLGLDRLAGDAWRSLGRAGSQVGARALSALERALSAYSRAGSAYGVAATLDARAILLLARGDREGFVVDVQRSATALAASLGAVSVQAWLNLAIAHLLVDRPQAAADGLAAATALGLDRLEGARSAAGLLGAVFAADGPSEEWRKAQLLLEDPRVADDDVLIPPLLDQAISRAEAAGLDGRAAWLRAWRTSAC